MARSTLVLAALLAATAAAGCGGSGVEKKSSFTPAARAPAPAAGLTLAAIDRTLRGDPRRPPFVLARVRQGVHLRMLRSPAGKQLGLLGSETRFGSPRVLPVVAVRGGWLGVLTPALPNGKLGWVSYDPEAMDFTRTPYSIRVSLSGRTLALERAGRTVQQFAVAVGRAGSETPAGRFAITDELRVGKGNASGPYGCCAIALTGHQPNLPSGWIGGDRIAIHGTTDAASVGQAASAGCIRASNADAASLMGRAPLGAPVFVTN